MSFDPGTFGVVCKATLKNNCPSDQLVAVKMARSKLICMLTGYIIDYVVLSSDVMDMYTFNIPDLSSKEELHSLLNESLLMKEFDHPNIVGLLGVSFDTPDGYPYLILPFMANGNIRDYLKDKRVHPTNTAALPKVCRCDYCSMMLTNISRHFVHL